MQQNAQRQRYDYATNQKVSKNDHDPTKLGIHASGRYKVNQVHENSIIMMQLRPGGTERINTQRVIPYKDKDGDDHA